MKLHTSLTREEVVLAFRMTRARGLMTEDVMFVQFVEQASRSHPNGFLIQLGTYVQGSGPTNSRYYKNSGTHGAASGVYADGPVWAATYDEWGWFIAELFARDPLARFGHYRTAADFHEKPRGKYRELPGPSQDALSADAMRRLSERADRVRQSDVVRAAARQVARTAELLNDKPADQIVFGRYTG